MIIKSSIKVRNYKCFGDDPQGFDRIMPINIIIGKNNSGKTSLIEMINYFCDSTTFPSGRDIKPSEIFLTTTANIDHIAEIKMKLEGVNEHTLKQLQQYVQDVLHNKIPYHITNSEIKINLPRKPEYQHFDNMLATAIIHPLFHKHFRWLKAERDITPEKEDRGLEVFPNGSNSTSFIQEMLTHSKHDSRIIERVLLDELNKIVNPEMSFQMLVTQWHDSGNLTIPQPTERKWEIYLDDNHGNKIPLSKMGSGIKTILLVLLNLIAIPRINNETPNEYLFAFEELENNLHPAILRRLFKYIYDYSKKYSVYFFITTHSNVVIDMFGNNPDAQIIHVTKENDESKATTVLTHDHSKSILKDLDIRASDLLQSNGIIWVEGPSDRIYLNKWISLVAPELQEGVHYSIMFYGGKLLANLTFDSDDWFNKEVVPLLKINTNAFVIIDRDGDTENTKLNETKTRIQAEINPNCWITKGREIENYLSATTLSKWVEKAFGINVEIIMDKDIKLENILRSSDKNISVEYNKNKKGFSIEIADEIEETDLKNLDLEENVALLVMKIKEWNSMF